MADFNPVLKYKVVTASNLWHTHCRLTRQGQVRMLKISLVDGTGQLRMVVEGALVPPWVDELTTACAKARVDLQGRELIVDLRGLTAISPEGENVLRQLMMNKTKVQCGVFIREVLRQLAGTAQLDLENDNPNNSDG
jgi:hypothetical protein